MDVSLCNCVNSVILYFTAYLIVNLTGTLGNPTGGDNDCIRKLQMICGAEYDTLSEHTGTDACRHLSKAVLCVACKVESCKDMFLEAVPEYNVAPYNCKLSQTDVGLLQGLPEYQAKCPRPATTEPSETSTHIIEPQNSLLGNNETSSQARLSMGYFLPVVLLTIYVLVLR